MNTSELGQTNRSKRAQEKVQESELLVQTLGNPIKKDKLEAITYMWWTWCRSVQALCVSVNSYEL